MKTITTVVRVDAAALMALQLSVEEFGGIGAGSYEDDAFGPLCAIGHARYVDNFADPLHGTFEGSSGPVQDAVAAILGGCRADAGGESDEAVFRIRTRIKAQLKNSPRRFAIQDRRVAFVQWLREIQRVRHIEIVPV